MKYSLEYRIKLLDALQIIQQTCRDHMTCDDCPLRKCRAGETDDGYCRVSRAGDSPVAWKFNGCEAWRAFDD